MVTELGGSEHGDVMTRNEAVQTFLRNIPRPRHAPVRFAFRVTPPVDEPLDIELWAGDLQEAVQRATHLAVQAYGAGTTVSFAG